MILAYETSTDVCSVAFQNSEGEIFEKRIQGRSVHSDHLFLFTQELMGEHSFSINQIKTVLVSIGPGSYTGLRIAASAIKGIFFQSTVEVYAVNTLAGFTGFFLDSMVGTVHSIIDARRIHVYHQQFEVGESIKPITKLNILEISAFEEMLQAGQKVIGTGLNRINPTKLNGIELFDSESISAENLIKLYTQDSESVFIKQTTLSNLDPIYITCNQVNNSSV